MAATRARRLGIAATALLLALVLGDVALSLFVLEDGRLGDRPLPPFGALPHPSQRAWLERQHDELERGTVRAGGGVFDAELGWTNTPFAPERADALCFSSIGARGRREYARAIPEGVTRVVTFGDSFTYCAEVGDTDAWQYQLEERRPDLEVPNFGVGGYGTDQALLRMRRELPRLEADVVLMGINVENIARNVNRYRPLYHPRTASAVAKPRFVLTGDALELLPSPFASRAELVAAVEDGSVLERVREHEFWYEPDTPLAASALGRLFLGWRAYARRQPEVLWADEQGEPFRVTLALLAAFRDEATASGARLAGVVISQRRSDLAGPEFWSPLRAALDRLGLAYVDLSRTLRPALERGEDLFTGGHLSRRGNELSAEAIERFLDERL